MLYRQCVLRLFSVFMVLTLFLVLPLPCRGEFSYDSPVRYRPLGELVMRTLEYSDNDTAGTVYLASGAAHEPYALAAYSGMEPEELPKLFRHFYFTSRFMLATLQTLYDEPDRFPGIVEHLKKACPHSHPSSDA